MSQLLNFAGFELRYHLRRPLTYVFMLAMFLCGFAFIASSGVRVGGASGAVHINAPYILNIAVATLTLAGTILTCAIAGTAILRDFELKTHELLFTTRLRKSSFVFGRFIGAWLVTSLVFASCTLGLWFGSLMPWVDGDKLGAFSLAAHLWPVLVYSLPNALLVSALFFAVGILTRSFLAVYIQGIVLFVAYIMAQSSLADIDNRTLGALLDPFGQIATRVAQEYWTVAEKNSELIPLTGVLLVNRLIWIGAALLVMLGAFKLFRMEAFPGARRRGKPVVAAEREPVQHNLDIPAAPRHSGLAAQVAGFIALVRLYYRDVVRARPFMAIVAIGMVFLMFVAYQSDQIYGTKIYPVTYSVVEVIESFSLFFLILTAVYAAELTWRERGLKCDQILDATPTSTTVTFTSKIVALLLVYATLLLFLIGFGLLFQTLKGYTHYEIDVYFIALYGVALPNLALVVFLAFFLQAIVDNKYLGIALLVGYYVLTLVLGEWGIQHPLAVYGGAPSPVYSAMNGFGPNVGMFTWMTLYYAATALVLLTFGRLLLTRGTPTGSRARLRIARGRVTRGWLAFCGLALATWAGLAWYAHHNIDVLNTYRNSNDREALQAEYERTYKQYLRLPQPRITGADVHVDLWPERGHARATGTYTLVNRHDAPIERVHVITNEALTIHGLEFAGGATLEQEDPRIRYQIWRLDTPLAPGATSTLKFVTGAEREGFGQSGRTTSVVANGSFINNTELMPMLGYQEGFELGEDDKRKEQGLPERPRMHAYDDMAARQNTYISSDSDWIEFKASVCTAPDQIAVAPGYLEREWQQDGRRCFAYAMDSKILHFYSFLSARYEVLRDEHDGVKIEVYYQKGHEYNLARMVEAVKKSLDYFNKNFGPYQHRQARILEFPRYASFAQAFPNTIPYSESIGFIARVRPDDPEDLDYPFYVTAHEIAHQWWAHQVIGADVQGATMLSESLAQYSALMVMEDEYGPAKMKKFLQYELRRYLGGRAFERKKELPLARNENQQYIHYAKGSLVFYALKDYIGEDRLNSALARLVKEQAFKGPPFAVADDLIKILRDVTPPEYQYLITDMFETITLYDNKASEASVEARDGKYHVKFKVTARKLRADDLGNETPVAIDDLIDVGVYAAPGPGDFQLGKPLFMERRKLTSRSADDTTAEAVIEVVVDEPPYRVGIDPYNKLIDRDAEDNTVGF